MLNLDWNNIRPINGSQKDGFEELVCQLSRNESISNSKSFVRKGAPDAGVECFWILEDGSEIAWQAKYFITPLSSTQWGEIDKSVKTMLNKHPNTKRYIISIPQDRADARIDGKKSFLQKWEERVIKWKKWAGEKSLKIDFEYEGSSELLNKLSLPVNSGKTFFWFNKNEFTMNWFKNQNDTKINDLGARYSPELNVELDIKYVFDGLYFDENYKKKTLEAVGQIDKHFQELIKAIENEKDQFAEFREQLLLIYDFFEQSIINIDVINSCQYDLLLDRIKLTRSKFLSAKHQYLKDILKKEDEKTNWKNIYFRDLENKLQDYISQFRRFDIKLAEKPILIIEGGAGIGKSHLVADVIKDRYAKNQYSILLLGQHFIKGNVWEQILKELDIKITKEEFLGVLNAKAESVDARIIIYIDAINEGEGKYIWEDRIRGIVNDIEQYKFLGIVFTIRSTYTDIVLPENFTDEINHFIHSGFDNNSVEATPIFFDFYKLEEPPIPILNPEFDNPLFLKLFCKGLHDNGITKIPDGYEGLTTIFNYVLEATNKAISKRLDYHYKTYNLVKEALRVFVQEILKTTSFILLKEEAYQVFTETFKNNVSNSRNVLAELINENILTENTVYNEQTEKYDREAIYFSYERFGDHAIVNALLEKEKHKILESKSIDEKSSLHIYFQNENKIALNKGIINALSIQLPEQLNLELYEIVPKNNIYDIGESFLDSLIWRSKESVNEKVLEYINSYITTVVGLDKQLKDTLVKLSIRKSHYLNARFLDSFLFKMKLNVRDHYWAIDINDSKYRTPYTIVRWVRERNIINDIDEETKRLLSLILSWFLTSSNRELRDNSTKALVQLFQNNLSLYSKLLLHFHEVNDMYILERLYAVAYGIALRSDNDQEIKLLAEFVFENIFKNKIPFEHLLLRDYARGVIEYAYYKGLISEIDITTVRPPYGSKIPDKTPSPKEIEKFNIGEFDENDLPMDKTTQKRLFDIIRGASDFAREEIGIDYNSTCNSHYSIITIKSKNAFQSFYSMISESRKKDINKIIKIAEFYYSKTSEYQKRDTNIHFKIAKILSPNTLAKLYYPNNIEKKNVSTAKKYLDQIPDYLISVFGQNKENAILISDFIKNSALSKNYSKGRFDMDIIQRLMVIDVFETYGWSFDKFGDYDYHKINYFSKHESNQKEAIGMKYIWMALHKWLAVLFDNYLIESSYSTFDGFDIYNGTWNPFKRDIDPSMLIEYSHKKEKYNRHEETFWSPKNFIKWENTDNYGWCFDKKDLVHPKNIIEVSYNDTKWLNLLSYPSWRKRDSNGNIKRQVWYHLKSFIVKKSNKKEIIEKLNEKDFKVREISSELEPYEVFSREYYWSNAYKECGASKDEWHNIISNDKDNVIRGIITAINFKWYGDKDFSKDKSIFINRPSKFVFDLMNLKFKESEHCFYSKNSEELIAYNPSIEYQKGFDSLLIKKDIFLDELDKNDLDIIWIVIGAKEVVASHKITNESRINNVFYFNEKKELEGKFELTKSRFM